MLNSCVLTYTASASRKEIYSTKKTILFPFRVDPFSDGRQNKFKTGVYRDIHYFSYFC